MREPKKANLFVVGAMKGGTTSFMELLSKHSDVYIPPIKEPNYFVDSLPKFLFKPSRFFSEDSYFEKDFPKNQHIAKLTSSSHYVKLFSLGGKEKYYVDGSTVYLAALESSRLIYEYNPEARIIVLLRNPLERMYSHYQMMKGLSRENRSFEIVTKTEVAQYSEGVLPWYSYLGMSLYEEQLKRYTELFKNVLLLNFETLAESSELLLEQVSNFLEIHAFTETNLLHSNKTRQLKYGRLFYFLKRVGLKDYFSRFLGKEFKQKLFRAVSTAEKDKMHLSECTLEELNAIFEKESRL